MKYRLIKAIKKPLTINVATRQNGFTKYGHMTLKPGELYETDDKVLISSLKGAVTKKAYSKELEDALQGCNYKITRCKSCGGRVRKIEYNVVEVFDD